MTTERTKWWRAFLPKRKSSKDIASSHTFDPDFDPFAQPPEKPREPASAASKTTHDQSQPVSQPEPNKSTSLFSDDTYDDSHLESVFNEQTCRRNMKVSRSGRFKEKKKVRSSLPIQEKETENGESGSRRRRTYGDGEEEEVIKDCFTKMLEEREKDLST